MSNTRTCPVLRASVEYEVLCLGCGHNNKATTGCEHDLNKHLVRLGHKKQEDYDKINRALKGED